MKKGIIVSLILVLLFGFSSVAIACNRNNGAEKGIYYYETVEGEYVISLDGGGGFSFYVKGDDKQGKYKLKNEKLTLVFSDKKDELEINYKGNTLDVVYKESQMTFYKKVEYTVSFESNGGQTLDAVKVINGKTISKPEILDKKNHTLIGWYDNAANNGDPFLFDTLRVTSDMTLHAKWAEKLSSFTESTIDFDLGEAEQEIDSIETIGGRLYSVPTPNAIEGKTFRGWWISMYEDRNKLSYRLPDDLSMIFEEDTTLFALWQDNGTTMPVVDISSTLIKWSSVGTTQYRLVVKGPSGYSNLDKTVTSTAETIIFADQPSGDYEITVTAQGATNSKPMTVHYKNKALNRVSHFTVLEPSTLVYNAVKNATRYTLEIECGSAAHSHNHIKIDNGNSTYYNFVNCSMPFGGIKFKVIAHADGFASSESREFTHDRILDEITGFNFDENTQLLSWKAVSGATNYIVSVACGEANHEHQLVDIGNLTSYSLKECSQKEGGIIVNVYPKTIGYNSRVSQVLCNKTGVATPRDIRIETNQVKWTVVPGITSYKIKIDNRALEPTTGSDYHQLPASISQGVHEISVMACGATDSLLSDPITVSNNIMSLTYSRNEVRWNHVYLAEHYLVQVNDREAIQVPGGNISKEITLDNRVNTIKVSAYCSGSYIDPVSIVVNAYKIEFNGNEGSLVEPKYYATGDRVSLPNENDIQKEDYTFGGWYVTSGGNVTNGKEYIAWYFDSASDIELYAYWMKIPRFVTYDLQEGALETGDIGKDMYIGEEFSLSVPTIANGKSFLGWYSMPNGQGTRYTDDMGVGIGVWEEQSNITVYAYWVNALNFRLELNGTYAVGGGDFINEVSNVIIPHEYFDIVSGVNKPVKIIDGYAFRDTTQLKKIVLPDTISSIEATAFNGCSGLEAIEIYHIEGNIDIVFAEDDGVLYKILNQDGDREIVVYPSAKSGAFIVPKSVSAIYFETFKDCTGLTSITIHNGIKSLGDKAFMDCINLDVVTFSDGGSADLTFGNELFVNCKSLKALRIPARFSGTINKAMFRGCSDLSKIDVDDTNKNYSSDGGVLYNKNKTTLLYCPLNKTGSYTIPASVSLIDASAFSSSKIETIVFNPRTVELTIGSSAFYSSSVSSLEFRPSSQVTVIKNSAFGSCTGLTELTIPSSVKSVESIAFNGCNNIAEIIIEDGGNPNFDSTAFQGCTRITEIYLPESYSNGSTIVAIAKDMLSLKNIYVDGDNPKYCDIDGVFFDKSDMKLMAFPKGKTGEYILPESMTVIPSTVFQNCRLTEIVIHKDVTIIEANSFLNCNLLEAITVDENNTNYSSLEGVLYNKAKTEILHFPKAKTGDFSMAVIVTAVPNEMFRNSKIVNVTINANININADFFAGSKQLRSVSILGNTVTIGVRAFSGCSVLETINLPDSLETIALSAFYECLMLQEIRIPRSVSSINTGAFLSCNSLTSIVVDPNNAVYSSLDGVLLNKNQSEVFYLPTAKTGNYTLPASVTKVPTNMFSNTELQNITILSNIDIPNSFFANSKKLISVTLNGNTTIIGTGAFSGCINLESVTLPSNLVTIRARAFENCVKIVSIIIPESVTTIEANAFSNWKQEQTIHIETHSAPPSGWVNNWDANCAAEKQFGYSGN